MDTKMLKKRERSLNWSEEDKHLLMELVRERVEAIENKNTDTNCNSKKQAAWADLHVGFNSMCNGTTRTIAQLKSQWGILKMTQKRRKLEERKQTILTGGGPPPPREPDNAEDISSWLPNEFIIDTNEFDSDEINQVAKVKQDAVHHDSVKTSEIVPKEVPSSRLPASRKKDMKKLEEKQKPTSYAEKIANFEIECRKELHEAQMKNEEKKGRILELKEILVQKKIAYYEKQNKLLEK